MQVVDIPNVEEDATVAEVKEEATIVEVKEHVTKVGVETSFIGIRPTSISLEANIHIQNVKKNTIYIYSICAGVCLLVVDIFFFGYRIDTNYEENYSYFVYYMLVMTIIMTLSFNVCFLGIKSFYKSIYPNKKIEAVLVALCTFLIIFIFYWIIILKYESLYNMIIN
ncbi:hypothetical protein GVAV_002426 [Gurleya vavrai]